MTEYEYCLCTGKKTRMRKIKSERSITINNTMKRDTKEIKSTILNQRHVAYKCPKCGKINSYIDLE